MIRISNPPDNLFVNGDPVEGTAGTIVDKDWLNHVQEELCAIVLASGQTLSNDDMGQILKAILRYPVKDARGYDSIEACIAAIGSTETTLRISAVYTLTSSITFPPNIHLEIMRGGGFILGDYNLTINGPVYAGRFQWIWQSGTGTAQIASHNVITPQYFGSGDTAVQQALDCVRDYGPILDWGRLTYTLTTVKTLLRNGSAKPVIWKFLGAPVLDFSASGLTSGVLFSLGATSTSYLHDRGMVKVGDMVIIGPETENPYSSSAPATSIVGLKMMNLLNPDLHDIKVSGCYCGGYTDFVFPLHARCLNFIKNYIGAYITSNSTDAQWDNCSFAEAHYGLVIKPGSGDSVTSQRFNKPLIESVKVGVHMDPDDDGMIEDIEINSTYFENVVYDHARMGIAWNFGTPETRGANRTGQIFNPVIRGGLWAGGPWTDTHKPVVASTNGTVVGGELTIPVLSGDIIGDLRRTKITCMSYSYAGEGSRVQTIIPGEGRVTIRGELGTYTANEGNILSVEKTGTGLFTINFKYPYEASAEIDFRGTVVGNGRVNLIAINVSYINIETRNASGALADFNYFNATVKGHLA